MGPLVPVGVIVAGVGFLGYSLFGKKKPKVAGTPTNPAPIPAPVAVKESLQAAIAPKASPPPAPVPVAAINGQRAQVATKDPAPEGDLIVRESPSATAKQIGGVDKNGYVIVIDASDATFAKIQSNGGRLPPVTGYVRKAFLRLMSPDEPEETMGQEMRRIIADSDDYNEAGRPIYVESVG